jgi:hypothetical protein
MDEHSDEFKRFLRSFGDSSRVERQNLINKLQMCHVTKMDDRKEELRQRVKGVFPSRVSDRNIDQICVDDHWFNFDTSETQVFLWEGSLQRWMSHREPIIKFAAPVKDEALVAKISKSVRNFEVSKVIQA